ncbi:ATP-dependent nuclease [Flavobacterium terrigena]|uniref:Putative ATP-dependent endonuclease of the OLD family n=1 Tax=Flavobacterium terrigena TaxID=402734 RepID=A0A1H6S844_9FLAO|nr:AAA family ATPase [Flavobacterium terrigena]SEI64059.1 putative ATP-dependent endonuclease of the OLD family [Flavobacterium terrigena]
MHISKVTLVNYRNFAKSNFYFKKGINTIIGENGSGKTNLFRAIRLLLDDSIYSSAYKLDEGDFNRSLQSWKGHWIIISIEFEEISKDEAIQALFAHGTAVLEEGEEDSKATYNLYFRPKADIRLRLAELAEGDASGLQTLLDSIDIRENYETVFFGKSTVDFSDPEVYKNLVGDFDNVKFPSIFDSSLYGVRVPNQLSVAKEISFTFIQALRDVVSDFHNNRTNPLLALLKSKSGDIEESEFEPISKMVKDLNNGIETLKDVEIIRDDIKSTIRDAVGETYSPSKLSIKSNLSEEADKLLQSLKLFVGEPEEDYEGGIHELSLGGANLIFLTLKLLEYRYRKTKGTFANFLIIEEPEAHIHTHIQKTLFDKLDYSDTQIIYSTHSTYISEVSDVSSINILAKKRNFAEVYQPSTGLSTKKITQIQRYLDAVRSNLLFAKGVILVEGDAEEILIPLLVKKVLGLSLDELGISLINIGSTGFTNVAQLFHDSRIRRKCSIITDLDKAFIDTTILDGDGDKLKQFKTKAKNSQVSGANRKVILDEFVDENDWISVFYAENTFEVDFVTAGNSPEVDNLVNIIYSQAAKRTQASADLASEDIALYGKRILTMANNEGKGWFAIMLGGYITDQTIIPDYILDAIIFAKQSFSRSLIATVVEYRIKANSESIPVADFAETRKELRDYVDGKIEIDRMMVLIAAIIPDDQIMDFLDYM